jgi:phospholipid transport system substrate-binding protein
MLRRILVPMIALAWLPLAAAAQQAAVPGPGPQELMQDTAQRMVDALDEDREGFRKDPQRVSTLVDQILLPHFDTQYSAQLVLGKHWRWPTSRRTG